jgi:hypothetical protein
MRTRTTVLAVALFLAAAALAGAATTPAPAAAPLPAFCAAAISGSHLALPVTPLPPFFAATLCGTCSDSHCLGHNQGSVCSIPGPGGGLGHCYTNDQCTDGTWQCQCQKGAD